MATDSAALAGILSDPGSALTLRGLANHRIGVIDGMERTCKVDGCVRGVCSWDWCEAHYRRWQRHGDPLGGRRPPLTTKGCEVVGCTRGHYARGWCRLHWERWRKHGDPLYTRPVLTLEERLWAKVDRRGPDECWPWKTGQRGYLLIEGGKTELATRIIIGLERAEPLLSREHVLHSCDNPPCCNPAHLSIGTHKENMEEMARKRRNARGGQHPVAVLTEKDVIEIRSAWADGATQRSLASLFSVACGTIADVIYRRTWRHI